MGDGFSSLQATVAAFGMFLPGVAAVRHHNPDDTRKRKDLRLGMALATGWSFLVAMHYANKSNSPVPYMYWAGGILTLGFLYEGAFRDRQDIDD